MLRLALAVGTLGVTVPLMAQPTPPPYEETVLVTASVVPEEQQDLAVSADFVGAEEISARQETSVAEALATVPGVQVVRSGAPGQSTSLFLRGTESDHTLVLWNGVELNDPFFGGFNWAFLATEGVERIEVVRGPYSSLWGADAVGGVVQVVSADRDGLRLDVEVGEDSHGRASLAAGTAVGTGHVDVAGHLRRGDGELDNSFFDSDELVARGEWELGRGRLGAMVRRQEADTGIPLSGGLPSPRRRVSFEESQIAVPWAVAGASWEVEGSVSRIDLDTAFRDPDDPFGFVASDTEGEALRGRVAASWAPAGERFHLAAGGDWERQEVSDEGSFGTNLDAATQRTWGSYLQAAWQGPGLHLRAGVRRDDNDNFGSAVSPRAGVVWAASPRTRLRASYGEGFRAPSLGELFFPFSGNPELEPEESESWEVGVDHRRGAWRLSLVGFATDLENLIDFDFATFRNVNVGRARIRGAELAVDWRGEGVESRASATLLDTEDRRTGLDLLRRADETASWSLTWRPGAWTLNALARWVGERDDVDPVTFGRAPAPSYLALDLAVRYRLSPRLAPYARLENAGDREYQEALGFPAPGRTAVVGLALDL